MLSALQTALRIGLSRTGVTLFKSTGFLRREISLVAERIYPDEAVPARLAARLDDVLAEHQFPNSAATIVLADECVRLMMVTPPLNAVRLQDCQAAAQLRFQALYGEPAADWKINGDWHQAQPFLACAMPGALHYSLLEIASRHRLKLVRLAPQFITAWNRWRHKPVRDAWFGIAHDNQLTLGAVMAERLHAVRVISVPSTAWQNDEWLPSEIAREALRLNLPVPQTLQVCGDIPGHWPTYAMGKLTCVRLDTAARVAHNGRSGNGAALALSGVRR